MENSAVCSDPEPQKTRLTRLNMAMVKASYRRYARIYDAIFGFSLSAGRHQAVRYLNPKSGDRILEIGVGTGLSLKLYPEEVKITGIDLSPEMLEQAKSKVERLKNRNIQLHSMDASTLTFDDDSFDVSIAMYVASVAPNPPAIVAEMKRVTRRGGQILIVNHFSRRGTMMCFVEKVLSPLAPLIGFQPLFYLHEFVESTGLKEAAVIPVKPLGYWYILAIQNDK